MPSRGPKKRVVEATIASSRPRKPSGLTPDSEAHWDDVVALLEEYGSISKLDADALELYLSLRSRWKLAEETIAIEGAVITAKNGYEQPSPWYAISVQCLKDMKSFLTMFGLTPMSRCKLKFPETEVIDQKWKGFE